MAVWIGFKGFGLGGRSVGPVNMFEAIFRLECRAEGFVA
jgi:hypothetical protein